MSGIYIHIPFCNKRCTYCDFFLVTNKKLLDDFLFALRKEIEITSGKFADEKFDTIYFGGGTPSILSSEQFQEILLTIKNNYNISPDPEITLEANPEDLIEKDISKFVKAGLNRLSLGVQSFNENELKFLTRDHTPLMAVEVVSRAKKFISNINIDIIYSLPSQSLDDIKFSLDKCIELDAKHISAYSLTYEPGTVLTKKLNIGSILKNTDKAENEMFLFIHDYLKKNGFDHYEISNYAKTGFESSHNKKYWAYKNYSGLGPSSHSYFNGKRWNNIRNLGKYISLLNENIFPIEEEHELNNDEKKFEFIMLGLRSKGIDLIDYESRFNENFKMKNSNVIDELLRNNYAIIDDKYFYLNEKGFSMADEIIARYF